MDTHTPSPYALLKINFPVLFSFNFLLLPLFPATFSASSQTGFNVKAVSVPIHWLNHTLLKDYRMSNPADLSLPSSLQLAACPCGFKSCFPAGRSSY